MEANWRPAQQQGGQASPMGPGVPVDGGGGGPSDRSTQIMETLKRNQQQLQQQLKQQLQQQMMNQQILALQQQQPATMDSTAQTGHAGGVDLQEELYQKVKSMKEQYFAELSELHQKTSVKLQQHEALMGPAHLSAQYEKLAEYKNLKHFRVLLERMISLLQIAKNQIPVDFKYKLPFYEKQIMLMIASHGAKKAVPQAQGQQQFQQPSAGNTQPVSQQQQASQSPVHQAQQLHSDELSQLKANRDVSRRSPEASGEPAFICPICWGTLTSPSSTVCGHMFCEGCIKSATQRRKECPTCRRKLSGRSMYHRVFFPSTSLS